MQGQGQIQRRCIKYSNSENFRKEKQRARSKNGINTQATRQEELRESASALNAKSTTLASLNPLLLKRPVNYVKCPYKRPLTGAIQRLRVYRDVVNIHHSGLGTAVILLYAQPNGAEAFCTPPNAVLCVDIQTAITSVCH